MSGTEAIAIVSLIDACIDIVKNIIDIGRAVFDAQGLPSKLRGVFDQLPAIEDLLHAAQEKYETSDVTEHVIKNTEPMLEQCRQALGKLREIFKEACPTDKDNRSKRIWKGTKAVFFGRESQLQKYLKTIQDNLRLLEQNQIIIIGDKLNSLHEIVEVLASDDIGKYLHTGAGNIFANEGGNPSNYVQSGISGSNNRQINVHGTYHEGGITHNYQPPERPERLRKPTLKIPYERDPDFIDRKTITNQINNGCSISTSRVALVGLGGVGKSQIAIEHCYKVHDQSEETWVLWIYASNPARYEQGVQDVIDLLEIPGRNDPKTNIYRLFRNWLHDKENGSWLIVLDNVDDARFLKKRDEQTGLSLFEYLPVCKHGTVLITSRDKNEALKLVSQSNLIPIGPMDEEQALELMGKKLGSQTENKADMTALLAKLEYIPLAITQAAAYIKQRESTYSVQKYLDKLQKSDRSMSSILNKDSGDLRRDPDVPNAIMLTWQISFDRIHAVRPTAINMLSLMSWCDRQAIPSSLLQVCDNDSAVNSERSDEESSEASVSDEFDDDIKMLEGYSFMSATADKAMFEMHRLVQLATQRWLKSEGQEERWKGQFIHKLYLIFPSPQYENWDICRSLYLQAKVAKNLKLKSRDTLLQQASVLYYAGWFALQRGALVDSEEMSMQCLQIKTMYLGENDPKTLSSMANLASTYRNQGRWAEAEELEVQVMKERKKTLDEAHPDTLSSMANLASTYWNQGRWAEAEELEVQVIKELKKVLGEAHPNTLSSIGNLASTYWNQGRWAEAEELEVQVIKERKKILGEAHPDTLSSMANLASTYWNQGRWAEAEELELQVMKERKKILGEAHPNTLSSIGNLASTYQKQGRWAEAEELEVQVIKERKKILGEAHPDTLSSMGNLALTYQKQGRWAEAEELEVQVIKERKKVLGEAHPNTLSSMANLASTYWNQGRWAEAEELQIQVLKARKEILGEAHPDTLAIMADIVSIYRSQGRLDEAEAFNTSNLAR